MAECILNCAYAQGSQIRESQSGSTAFFKSITVAQPNVTNYPLLRTNCRGSGVWKYSIMCYHEDHENNVSGASSQISTLLIIAICIIVLLLGLLFILFSKRRKEQQLMAEKDTKIQELEERVQEFDNPMSVHTE
jgi:LPXTG-motif cell wall-anchored protein